MREFGWSRLETDLLELSTADSKEQKAFKHRLDSTASATTVSTPFTRSRPSSTSIHVPSTPNASAGECPALASPLRCDSSSISTMSTKSSPYNSSTGSAITTPLSSPDPSSTQFGPSPSATVLTGHAREREQTLRPFSSIATRMLSSPPPLLRTNQSEDYFSPLTPAVSLRGPFVTGSARLGDSATAATWPTSPSPLPRSPVVPIRSLVSSPNTSALKHRAPRKPRLRRMSASDPCPPSSRFDKRLHTIHSADENASDDDAPSVLHL